MDQNGHLARIEDSYDSDLRITFNTETPLKYGTARIFHRNMANEFRKLGVEATFRDWDYNDKDVLITKAHEREVRRAKAENSDLTVGVVHPSDNDRGLVAEIEAADFLICNTEVERDYYLKYNPNIVVTHHAEYHPGVMKSYVDGPDSEPIEIAYHGNKGHLETMKHRITPALDLLGKEYDVRFVAVYNVDSHGKWTTGVPNIDVEHVQHAEGPDMSRVHRRLSQCDIGIVPNYNEIPEQIKRLIKFYTSKWSSDAYHNDWLVRHKNTANAGRAFVFYQLGLPVVASPVPECARVVVPERTGYLAHETAGWVDALERLVRDRQRRREMGLRGRKLVEEQYTMSQSAAILLSYIEAYESRETNRSTVLAENELSRTRPPRAVFGALQRFQFLRRKLLTFLEQLS